MDIYILLTPHNFHGLKSSTSPICVLYADRHKSGSLLSVPSGRITRADPANTDLQLVAEAYWQPYRYTTSYSKGFPMLASGGALSNINFCLRPFYPVSDILFPRRRLTVP